MTDDPFRCRCVLCHDYGDRDEADGVDLTVIEHVQQHGWHVVNQLAVEPGDAGASLGESSFEVDIRCS